MSDAEVESLECRTYSVREVAKILGIGRNSAYESCQSGEIPNIRVAGRILVPKSAVDELLASAGRYGQAS